MAKIETVGTKRKYDKSHLTWVDGKGWEGIVYTYTLVAPGDDKNGWVYVGCTPEEGTRRAKWMKPKNKYAGRKIAAARAKYGIDKFSYNIVETHYDIDIDRLVDKLEQQEEYYIALYDSYEHGFNSNKGGTGRNGQKISDEEIAKRNKKRAENGFHHTDDAKKRISETSKGRRKSQEEKDKISAGNKGKKRTEEMNQKQSARMKGQEPTAATEGARKWVEKNGGGYWKGKMIPEEARANMKAAQQAKGTKTRAHLSDGSTQDFTTMLDAAKAFGINVGSVNYSIKKGSVVKKVNAWFEKLTEENEVPRK